MISQSELKEICRYNTATGELIRTKKIRNSKPEGYPLGSTDGKGYLSVQLFGIQYKVHRLVWLYNYGEFPSDNLDHIDGNRKNNLLSNLRIASYSENAKNLSKDKRNKTGVTGVSASRTIGKFEASIGVNKKLLHLGTFSTLEEAKDARIKAEAKYGFHISHGKDKPWKQ